MLCTSIMHRDSQSPPPHRNLPRDPTGQGPPNSSLLLAVVSTTLLAPGRKAVLPTAIDPPGPGS